MIWTKTVFKSTKTTTLPNYATPTGSTKFQLIATNNPYAFPNGSENYVFGEEFLVAGVAKQFADTFSIVKGSLHEGNSIPCWFGDSNEPSGSITCAKNPPGTVVGPANVHIDCFGNLQGYIPGANTWTTQFDGEIQLAPQNDPVHQFNETGSLPIPPNTDDQYISLHVLWI